MVHISNKYFTLKNVLETAFDNNDWSSVHTCIQVGKIFLYGYITWHFSLNHHEFKGYIKTVECQKILIPALTTYSRFILPLNAKAAFINLFLSFYKAKY